MNGVNSVYRAIDVLYNLVGCSGLILGLQADTTCALIALGGSRVQPCVHHPSHSVLMAV